MRKPRIRGNLPAGPVFSLLLVGLLLLSGLLYYRAVNVQRFVEPALALSLPRSELAQRIAGSLEREFGAETVPGIRLRSSSIIMDKALLISPHGTMRSGAPAVLKRMARVYLTALDEQTRRYVGMILVIVRYPARTDESGAVRSLQQLQAWMVLDTMLGSEPGARGSIGRYFASAAIPASQMVQDPDTIEFQIIPSELMHADVLQKLVKYIE